MNKLISTKYGLVNEGIWDRFKQAALGPAYAKQQKSQPQQQVVGKKKSINPLSQSKNQAIAEMAKTLGVNPIQLRQMIKTGQIQGLSPQTAKVVQSFFNDYDQIQQLTGKKPVAPVIPTQQPQQVAPVSNVPQQPAQVPVIGGGIGGLQQGSVSFTSDPNAGYYPQYTQPQQQAVQPQQQVQQSAAVPQQPQTTGGIQMPAQKVNYDQMRRKGKAYRNLSNVIGAARKLPEEKVTEDQLKSLVKLVAEVLEKDQ